MRSLILVALLLLTAGCGNGLSDDDIKNTFERWCKNADCELREVKEVKRVESSDIRVLTHLTFSQGVTTPKVVEANCLFTKPEKKWQLQTCWSKDLGIER
jgi:hypothetical protein